MRCICSAFFVAFALASVLNHRSVVGRWAAAMQPPGSGNAAAGKRQCGRWAAADKRLRFRDGGA